jgi:hypothetical protein
MADFNVGINRYPEDLGSTEKYHYIVFHICEQTKSSYKTALSGADTAYVREAERLNGDNFQTALRKNTDDVANIISAGKNSFVGRGASDLGSALVDATIPKGLENFGAGAAEGIIGEISQTVKNAGNINFLRTVRRTKETIALYMPDTLNFVQAQGYSDLNLGNNLVTALFTGGKAVSDTIKQFSSESIDSKTFGNQLAKNISPYFVNAIGNAFGDVGKATAAAGQGFVANPMIEVLYTSPSLRQFRYDFLFYPRSASEAQTVQNIINLFSFHQAPEILPGSSGYFLVPPSEFDIEFYYNGSINVNIPKLSTCVLTGMDVDYAPNGWAAYQIGSGKYPSMGGTGMPVGIRMSLDFKETSIVTKASRQFASLGKNRNTEGNRINFAAENPPIQLTPGTYFTPPPAAVAAADAADAARQAFIDTSNAQRK